MISYFTFQFNELSVGCFYVSLYPDNKLNRLDQSCLVVYPRKGLWPVLIEKYCRKNIYISLLLEKECKCGAELLQFQAKFLPECIIYISYCGILVMQA